jgi:uncharacterized protein YbaR (Trm112 family)
MLAAMHVLAALGEQDGPLSVLMGDYSVRAASGEINSTVADAGGRDGRVRWAWAPTHGVTVEIDTLDGTHGDATSRGADVVVQPAGLEHRAAAAPQRRGRRRRHDGFIRDCVLGLLRQSTCSRRIAAEAPAEPSEERPASSRGCARSCAAPVPVASCATTPARTGPELVCTNAECGLAYPIDDGIPVLLADLARKPV